MVELENCAICLRNVKSCDITLHHYLPKSKGGTLQDTMRLCKCCHQVLHYVIELDAVEYYDTVDKLYSHHEFFNYIVYIRSVKHGSMYTVKQIAQKLNKLKVA